MWKGTQLLFDICLPCVTKKTTWEIYIAVAAKNGETTQLTNLCTVSDEAFVLLMLENSFRCWLDLHCQGGGTAVQQ